MRRLLWLALACLCCAGSVAAVSGPASVPPSGAHRGDSTISRSAGGGHQTVNAREKANSNNFKGPKSPRSVNVALETLLKFDDKDRAQSLRVLNNIQSLLTKLKDALVDEHVVSNRASEAGVERNDFSDFLKKAIDVLVTYTDRDLENIAKASANEVGGCSGSVCAISELNDDDPLKDIFTRRQQQISGATGKDIRAALKKTHHKLEYDTGDKNNEFIEYIDDIYHSLDKNKLKQFINQLHIFKARRNKASLRNMMKENLRRAVFEPVKKLEAKTRRDLILRLNAFCDEDIEDESDRRSELRTAIDNDNGPKRNGSKSKSNRGGKQSRVLYLRKRPRRRYTTTERLITHELGATINIGNGIDFRARMTDRSSEDENKHKAPHRRHMSPGGGGDHAGSDKGADHCATDENFQRNLENLGTKEEASKEKKTNSPERLEEKTKKKVTSDEESPEGTTAVAPSGHRNLFVRIVESSGEGAGEGDGSNTNESDGGKPAVVERADHENDISESSNLSR